MDYTWIIYICGYRYFWIQWNAKHCDTPCLGPLKSDDGHGGPSRHPPEADSTSLMCIATNP